MKILSSLVITLTCFAFVGCETATENQKRGAGVGAATGAVLGGVIGHQSGHAVEGAAIGAAAGGAAGGAYGTRQDRREAEQRTGSVAFDQADADSYGYAPSDYLALMTPSEMDILRSRTSSRETDEMADHLTAEEKENLRRRAALAE